MGLFQKIFGKSPPVKVANYFKTLNGYTPVFTTWRGGVYESELCRAAIEAGANQAGKLSVQFVGAGKPKLISDLRQRPCAELTWSQFMRRVFTVLQVDNTAFIVPVVNDYGETVGVYPIRPEWWELVESKNGTAYVRFHFESNQTSAVRLSEVGILNRHQYESDYFGTSNEALRPTLDLISVQNQGIREAIRNSASFRFIVKASELLSDDDLAEKQKNFTETMMAKGHGGVLVFPNEFTDIKQVTSTPYQINADEIKTIRTNVFDYFNTNEKIIQSSATDEELDAYFNTAIEPFSIQLSEVLTAMLFTKTERSFGNRVDVAANRLQYMSVTHKVALVKELGDRGAILVDEIRELFNYPPLPDGAGKKAPTRGEYYDAIVGKGENNNES